MKRQFTLHAIKFSLAVVGIAVLVHACNKAGKLTTVSPTSETVVPNQKPAPVIQNNSVTQVVTVGGIRKSADGSYMTVFFHENEQVFMVNDAGMIAALQAALSSQTPIKVKLNPWSASVLSVNDATPGERQLMNAHEVVHSPGNYMRIAGANIDPETLNNLPAAAVINVTTPGLTNVIPDMATAQTMFDYISHQCCALGTPILIDHCIPFQYCEDGCYARAHKMCWILNNTFHYGTHKIFSFAYGGAYTLSVKAEKWGGCCINWWYHVAPLVNIKTPQGVKAYVFDPAMFDQPVLLATWLHAQQNPSCEGSGLAGVTSINIQPTASYSPIDTAHFDTDPTYSYTNSTLVGYAPLTSCP